MDLTGTWRAHPADETLRRGFHLPGFCDDSWHDIEVPGHWRDDAALANETAVLHRREFSFDAAAFDATPGQDGGARFWLELDGVFTQGDVWMDGNYLGDSDGYFVRHGFEVTEELAAGADHVVAVEATCAPAGAHGRRRALLGIYEGGNEVLPESRPGGIWAPVRIRRTGPVRIERLRSICTHASDSSATIAIRAVLISATRRTVHLRTEIAGTNDTVERQLAEGINSVEWTVDVRDAERWWPYRLGEPVMHDLIVHVDTRHGECSDRTSRRIGLRTARMRKWRLEVNGEPLFVKGANLAPTGPLPAHVDVAAIDTQLGWARDAGLDLVRPYVHVADPRFYERCDDLGLLVWQDLPLRGHAATGLRSHATTATEAMVDQLGHHPSIVTWNAHVAPAEEWMSSGLRSTREKLTRLAEHQLPTPTRSVLDRSIKSTFERCDGSRHSSGFTGVLPNLPRLETTATHLWFGWRQGVERDLPDFAGRWPNQVRFVAEFGAQSVPDADVLDAAAWPAITPTALAAAGAEVAAIDRYVPMAGHRSFAAWRDATQAYQAGLIRRQIEALRRLAYRPTGGFCLHLLADVEPVIGFGTIDHTGAAKPAYRALAEACRPVIVVADRLPATLHPRDALAIDIHIVNERRDTMHDAVTDAELTWSGGSATWRFGGDIAPDSVTRVGTLSWVVPDAPGLATLTLTVRGPVDAVNRYDATIRR